MSGIGDDKTDPCHLRVPSGEGDGMGGYIDCSRKGRASGERGEGLTVSAAEFQDGGAGIDARESCRCPAPEVPPPSVVLVPGGCAIGHAADIGVARR